MLEFVLDTAREKYFDSKYLNHLWNSRESLEPDQILYVVMIGANYVPRIDRMDSVNYHTPVFITAQEGWGVIIIEKESRIGCITGKYRPAIKKCLNFAKGLKLPLGIEIAPPIEIGAPLKCLCGISRDGLFHLVLLKT